MQLGEVIRKYRKNKNMTQEEMAKRLGVTAPAVNKWERGNSFPDIMLLAPIARLLGITLDTLLSYREELTAEEVNEILQETNRLLKEKTYEEAFQWAKGKVEQYPDCEPLIWQIAVIFDAQRIWQKVADAEKYDEYLCSLYSRALESSDEAIRNHAAGALFGLSMRRKRYDKAEEYLEYFSKQDPERKRRQAQLYGETGRIQEAYKAYEELLFVEYQMVNAALYGMYTLAIQSKDIARGHMLVKKLEEAAKCFEMGKYYEVSYGLEIATLEKDADTIIAVMEQMLASVGELCSFRKAPLYEHMKFKEVDDGIAAEVKNNLLQCFCDEETYGFLKEDKRWQELAIVNR